MKEKYIKIIFFVTIVICIAFGIYNFFKTKVTSKIEIEENKKMHLIYDTITFGIVKPNFLNPILSTNQDMQYILKLIYQPLIEITKDFKLEPGLALEWSKISQTEYLIKLKDNIFWHDGVKFNATDLEYTINKLKEEGVESVYKENVQNINSIDIIDNYTVKINLSKEVPMFEYLLCFPIIKEEENTGTGIYRIDKITDDEIILKLTNEVNEKKLKKLVIKMYNSNAELYTAFDRKEVDIIRTDDINIKNYTGRMGISEETICGREFDYIKINLNNRILSNKEVREAIKYAINKNEIVYDIYNNYYKPASFPLEYGSYLCPENTENTFNVVKAKQILNEYAEQKNGSKIKLELVVNKENENRVKVAEIIKTELEEIGIHITIREISYNEYIKILEKENYELILTGNIVPIMPDVNSYFGEECISNLQEINRIENEEILKEKYKELIEKNNAENYFIGLYFNSNIILYNSNINGIFKENWYNIFYDINTWYKTE